MPLWTISTARLHCFAQAADLVERQGGVAAVDMADHVGVGLEHDILVDQAGAGDRRAAGVDRALDAVFARPGDHLLGFLALLDAAQADLAEQLDAVARHLGEIRLLHALLDHRRAGMDLHAGRAHGVEGALGRHRQRLEADDVLGPAGQMDLAGRDHRGDAAVEEAVDPVELVLARRPVAEHRMDVAVDQAGRQGRAFGVDHGVGPAGIQVAFLAEAVDPAVHGDDAVGVQDRLRQIAGQHQPDIADDRLALRRRGGNGKAHGVISLSRAELHRVRFVVLRGAGSSAGPLESPSPWGRG